ncbi:hypothetical protein CR105_03080 [Massilia eurypsychrophila]|uniref:Uncharacterized protein n=1 Tax=Massilia eurypsychrophila TaxID=1485217 RepID=A0A2G8TJG4_9BURK|nr:hypothetical protein CR105_03080 [Massilia eurypsychrophila]
MRQWTPEQRARQSALIRTWKPWERSTGPSTEAGKAIAAGNSLKHGMRSSAWIAERNGVNEILLQLAHCPSESSSASSLST